MSRFLSHVRSFAGISSSKGRVFICFFHFFEAFQPILYAQATARFSTNPDFRNEDEPLEVYRQRYLKAFSHPELDGWWLRRHLQNLHLDDNIPDTEMVSAALKACRKMNELSLAIRFIESLAVKSAVDPSHYDKLIASVKPVMDELGIPSLKELGYDKPELALVQPFDDYN
ncbi:Cytochrome c oxidase subunit 5A [Cichlidogyrus casuarinus]|uniref:Cytochrome c oxidase subunit 5A, mitochondrial n=1 Tax=Cichlidogyrus casuarinus TaxID=1844966 RepID=A0ABD2QIW1_9PLAT